MKGLGNRISNKTAIESLQINPALYDAVFSALPKNLDKLEKSIYIYAKLCSLLSYDSEYWATENNDYLLDKFKRHIDLDSISSISPTNSEVVCVDFNLIFSKMLALAGIKSHTYTKGHLGDDEIVEMYHTDVVIPFSSLAPFNNSFLKSVDPTHIMLTFAGYYDMNNIKLVGEITNISCYGFIPNRLEFNQHLDEVTERITSIVNNEKKSTDEKASKSEQKLQMLLAQYEGFAKNQIFLKRNESIQNFFKLISQNDMAPYPALLFASKAFKKTLLPLNNENFVAQFSIVKERDEIEPDLFHMVGIISLGVKNNPNFIKLVPPANLTLISKQELQNKFARGDINYISNLMPRPKHLVPHIYSPYLECRYGKLFANWNSSLMATISHAEAKDMYNSEKSPAGTYELFDYYDTWHREKEYKN